MGVVVPFIDNGYHWYYLDKDGNHHQAKDLEHFIRVEGKGHHLKQTAEDFVSNIRISTVFLGLDHSHVDNGVPILWETMLFAKRRKNQRFDQTFQWRYTSKEDAIAKHQEIVKILKSRRSLNNLDNNLDRIYETE